MTIDQLNQKYFKMDDRDFDNFEDFHTFCYVENLHLSVLNQNQNGIFGKMAHTGYFIFDTKKNVAWIIPSDRRNDPDFEMTQIMDEAGKYAKQQFARLGRM